MNQRKLRRAPGGRGFASATILGLSLVAAPGCAMFRGAAPEPEFVTVAVVARGQSDMDLGADSTGKSALVGGGSGAASAAAVGAGTGAALGVTMGPFAPAAVPLFAAIFAAGGAVAGATTGLVLGSLQGLPGEKAEQLTAILATLAESRDFQGELRSSVENTVPSGRRATSSRADASAILELTEIELEQHMGDGVSVHMKAAMILEWGPGPETRHSKNWDYEYDSPERHVDEWLAEDGHDVGAFFTGGIDTIAGEMSRDLLAPATR